MHNPTKTAPIVVAVDGGSESRRALRWAAKRARELGCEVRVVTAFSAPNIASESGMAYVRSFQAAEMSARDRAKLAIDRTLPGQSVEHIVRLGDAASILHEASSDARMIVVGTRRRERLWHRLRPSLTNRLTGLATCPVVSIGTGEQPR